MRTPIPPGRTIVQWSTAALGLTVLYFALLPAAWLPIAPSGWDRHALAFAVLAVLLGLGWPATPVATRVLLLALFGGGIELAQGAMGVGRSAQWDDLLIDLAVAVPTLAGAAALGRLIPAWRPAQ